MKKFKIITIATLIASMVLGGLFVFAADGDMVLEKETTFVDANAETVTVAETENEAETESAKISEKQDKNEQKEIEKTDKITVKINGKEVDFSQYNNVLPCIENDFTLVPIRAIAEGLGFEVNWNESTKTVEINGKTKIIFVIDSNIANVNGENITLDIPARIIDDRTFIPLRFVSEKMETMVEWNDETRTVSITEKNERPDYGDHGEMGGGIGGPGGGITAGAQGDRKPNVETDLEIAAVIEEGAPKFKQFVFEDSETGISLEYSIYIPENYDENKMYPMIMYIPDASGASKSAKEIVEQYYGADIWVTDEEQAKHESFVLVPAFSVVVVDDNWNTSEEIETAVNLISNLAENYSIDINRLYTTGQSMGCMTSLYLNSKYPDLFAASLFVSGQWDVTVLQPLENQKFFYITAGGDSKASGGQDEVKAMFDADGILYSYGTWSAQNSADEQNASSEELISQEFNANMIRFEKGTVLAGGSGMEHNASFNYGYKISAVRDWVFAQSK